MCGTWWETIPYSGVVYVEYHLVGIGTLIKSVTLIEVGPCYEVNVVL